MEDYKDDRYDSLLIPKEKKIKYECKYCGSDIFKDEYYWTDNMSNTFCSENCINEYYGIREVNDEEY